MGAGDAGRLGRVGLPSVNSIVAAFVLYVVAGRLGLLRGIGVSRTEQPDVVPAPAVTS